ncbi:MAG: histidinol-phosphatase [Actinomycetaceae bacterium]|nr:histidinol-phosphatase [Actinomycetaceae bacterium]MDU0969681.1 histidinol-phosphatase [Actinomycetaceae bacterium]
MTSPSDTTRSDSQGPWAADLALALRLADIADAVTYPRYGALDLRVESKADMTPVTDADRASEDAIRHELAAVRPDDAIVGEERGGVIDADRAWIIDPIDGTKNFVRGVPVWATLIALVVDGHVVVGCVSAPALARRWWASAGAGAYTSFNGHHPTPIHVSQVDKISDASVSYSSLSGWHDRDLLDPMVRMTLDAWRSRAFGDFWSYMLLAEGSVDITCEPELALHDMAALVPIVEEAGGRFTSLDGREGPWGGNALATNGLLHAQALTYVGTPANRSDPRL